MLKSIINITIALVLSFSIVGPSLLSFVIDDVDIIEITDIGEEEKKEAEKKEEKVLTFYEISVSEDFQKKKPLIDFIYNAEFSTIALDIIIPPPDFQV